MYNSELEETEPEDNIDKCNECLEQLPNPNDKIKCSMCESSYCHYCFFICVVAKNHVNCPHCALYRCHEDELQDQK